MINILTNFDLLTVGVAIAAIGILGFVIFLNNRQSATHRGFLFFSLITIFWSVANYLFYQIKLPLIAFWLLRLVIFLGVWHSFSFFQLSYVFPCEKVNFPKWYKFFLMPFVALVSFLTLTPLVFKEVVGISTAGEIAKVANGPGIFIFGIVVLGNVIGGVYLFIKKAIKAVASEKKQFQIILIGMAATFFLLMTFNFILPAFFDNPRFIPLGAVFLFPFVIFTFYAISKHYLLNVRIIATEILTFFLTVAMLVEVILSKDLATVILRISVFTFVLIFGILLIRSVRREVEQRQKLQELNSFKSELLSIVSHQIRNPLTIIKGYSFLIGGNIITDQAKIKEVFLKIKASADKLIDLLNNLLDLGRLEDGRMHYDFEKLDVNEILKETVDDFQFVAKEKGLEIIFEPALPKVKVSGDKYKLSQAFRNLIDNAVKYTKQGWVKINLQLITNNQQQNVLITISDSGVGVSKETIGEIFKKFVRVGDEKEILGSGLGLYVCKEIIEAHSGKIWAESEGKGKGSKFFVELAMIKN